MNFSSVDGLIGHAGSRRVATWQRRTCGNQSPCIPGHPCRSGLLICHRVTGVSPTRANRGVCTRHSFPVSFPGFFWTLRLEVCSGATSIRDVSGRALVATNRAV